MHCAFSITFMFWRRRGPLLLSQRVWCYVGLLRSKSRTCWTMNQYLDSGRHLSWYFNNVHVLEKARTFTPIATRLVLCGAASVQLTHLLDYESVSRLRKTTMQHEISHPASQSPNALFTVGSRFSFPQLTAVIIRCSGVSEE